MKLKKLMAMLLAGVMTVGMLAGCGGGSSSSSSSQGSAASNAGGKGEVYLLMSQRDEWLSSMEAAAKKAAEAAGYTLTAQDSQSDINKQIGFVETAANAGSKSIIVNLVDVEAAQSVIDAAGDMKVVFVNRIPADESVLNENAVYVGSNEMTSGQFQGDALVEYFKAKGQTEIKYILLNGILGQTSTTNRTKSVLQALEDGGIKATEASGALACEYDRAKAIDKISPLLTSGLEFDCIISNNDAMALGAIEACENANIDPTSFPIVGIDCTKDGAAAVESGKMYMTVYQNPLGQGEASVQAAINLAEGKDFAEGSSFKKDEKNPNILWVPFEPVTKDNVADYM